METIKVVVFDLDDTLINGKRELFSTEIIEILEYLTRHKYIIVMATHNDRAKQRLSILGIDKYFKIICCQGDYDKGDFTKIPHFERIKQELTIEYNSWVFFDDMSENVDHASSLGIRSILVNPNTGVTFQDLTRAGL